MYDGDLYSKLNCRLANILDDKMVHYVTPALDFWEKDIINYKLISAARYSTV